MDFDLFPFNIFPSEGKHHLYNHEVEVKCNSDYKSWSSWCMQVYTHVCNLSSHSYVAREAVYLFSRVYTTRQKISSAQWFRFIQKYCEKRSRLFQHFLFQSHMELRSTRKWVNKKWAKEGLCCNCKEQERGRGTWEENSAAYAKDWIGARYLVPSSDSRGTLACLSDRQVELRWTSSLLAMFTACSTSTWGPFRMQRSGKDCWKL